jgi:putative transposase
LWKSDQSSQREFAIPFSDSPQSQGWHTNLRSDLSISGSGLEAMGSSSATRGTVSLVAFETLLALYSEVVLDFSRPGKPTDNAFIEAFNGRFRAECLNTHWFMSLEDAREKLEDWRRDYNEVRPHGAIGNKVPIELMKSGGELSPSS